MDRKELFDRLVSEFVRILEEHDMASDEIIIKARGLSPEEAIGNTSRKDYPILSGREVMLEAEYRGSGGQAFTSAPSGFRGKLSDILDMDIDDDPHVRGLFIAAMNAVMRYLGLADRTIHCKDGEPEECARQAAAYIKENYGTPRIALVGYQPALLETLSKEFPLRVLDLNPDNVGSIRYGIKVEHGEDDRREVVDGWAQLILCTGSTLCNGTIVDYLDIDKEVLFFGTTLSGSADMLGCRRICFCAR